MSQHNINENSGQQVKFDQIMVNVQQAIRENRLDEAVYLLNSALLFRPDDAFIYNNLGVIYYSQNNFDLSKNHFLKALELNPQYFDACLNLTKVFRKQADCENALMYAQKCCVLQPQNVKAIELLQSINGTDVKPQVIQESSRCEHPLHILFVQDAPCIRNYKMASALRARGHEVTLAWTRARLSQMYPGLTDNLYTECIQLTSHRHLWDLSKKYDIVHCHNEPDLLTVAALAGKTPVIHDTHDLISLRSNGDPNLSYFEGVANHGAAGRVYTTPFQMQEAQQLYDIDGPSIVLYNYTSQADLPDKKLPRLSLSDGNVHIVYEGGIGGNIHRNFIELFRQLAQNHIHIHIYPTFFSKELADFFAQNPNIHYYQSCSPKQIMEQMTQYDIGIIPFNLDKGNKRFLDSTIANKLFEYLAAGLPVLTSPLLSYTDFFAKYPVGMTFANDREIMEKIPHLLEIGKSTDFSKYIFTFENEIVRLEDLYNSVLNFHIKTPPAREKQPLPSCPICQQKDCAPTTEQNGLHIYNCPKCETFFVHPCPDEQFLRIWYSEEEKKRRWNNDLVQAIEANHKQNEYNYSFYFKSLQENIEINGKGRILDIGCYDGLFLQRFKALGYDCTGIDLNEGLLRYGREKYNLDLKCGTVFDFQFPANSFDIIFFHQVLEHQANPVTFIAEVKRILAKDGVICFSVPNAGALRFQLQRQYFPADGIHSMLDLPNHLFYFSRKSLQILLEASQFSDVVIKSYGQPDSIYDLLKTQNATDEQIHEAKNQLLISKNLNDDIQQYSRKVIFNSLASISKEFEEKTDSQPGLLVIAGKIHKINDNKENQSGFIQNIPYINGKQLSFDNPNLVVHLSKATIQLYKWLKLHGSVGFDPGDINSHILQLDACGQKINKHSYTNRQFSEPMKCRSELNIPQYIYPDSVGLFLSAFCFLPFELEDLNIQNRINYCYDTLLNVVNKEFDGYGWGFPYPRENHSILPAGIPDAITTYFAGDGLWNFYKKYNNPNTLADCCRVADFYYHGLNNGNAQGKICFSLTPVDYLFSHSATLFAAEYLLRLGLETNNTEWISAAKKAIALSSGEIKENGYLPKYSQMVQSQVPETSPSHIDLVYHLLALNRIARLRDDRQLKDNVSSLMDYYIKYYFTENLLPIEPDSKLIGIDVLTLGMTLVMLSETAEECKPAENLLLRLLTFTFDHLINTSGSFVYSFEINHTLVQVNRFPYFIRCQASIFNGLMHALKYSDSCTRNTRKTAKSRKLQEVNR